MAPSLEITPCRCVHRLLIGLAWIALAAGTGPVAVSAGPPEPLVSLQAQNRPLGDVLAEVARKTGTRIALNNQWRGYPVTASIEQMPLSKALKRILASLNHTVVYASSREIRIEVYGEATARTGPQRPVPSYSQPVAPPEAEPSAEPSAEPPMEKPAEEPDQREESAGIDGEQRDRAPEAGDQRSGSDTEASPPGDTQPADESVEKPAGRN